MDCPCRVVNPSRVCHRSVKAIQTRTTKSLTRRRSVLPVDIRTVRVVLRSLVVVPSVLVAAVEEAASRGPNGQGQEEEEEGAIYDIHQVSSD